MTIKIKQTKKFGDIIEIYNADDLSYYMTVCPHNDIRTETVERYLPPHDEVEYRICYDCGETEDV